MQTKRPAAAKNAARKTRAAAAPKVGAVLTADCGDLGETGKRVQVSPKARDKLIAEGKARGERPTDRGIFGFGI